MAICVICGKGYSGDREMTCSGECHEKLVELLIDKFGEFKKVIRASTGIAYKVPTRDIIEMGVKEQDLDRYPVWEDGNST